MEYYDAEISIQDVDPENEEIFREGWMYVTVLHDKKNPEYFAPYFTLRCDKPGISMISRVMYNHVVVLAQMQDIGVEPPSANHGDYWRRGLDLLCRLAKERGYYHLRVQLRYLDSPEVFCDPPITKNPFSSWVKTLPERNPPTQIGPTRIPKGFSKRWDDLQRYLAYRDSETGGA